MSVRDAVLALLDEQPRHAYQLKQEFEERTSSTWPLNVAQISGTLQRLMRDGLVELDEPADASESAVIRYRLTPTGREAVQGWWTSPVARSSPARDDLMIKLAMAVSAPGVDVGAVVQRQRHETVRALQDLTALKKRRGTAAAASDLTWSLMLDRLTFDVESELRWLDHVEDRLRSAAHRERSIQGTSVRAAALPPVRSGR